MTATNGSSPRPALLTREQIDVLESNIAMPLIDQRQALLSHARASVERIGELEREVKELMNVCFNRGEDRDRLQSLLDEIHDLTSRAEETGI